MNRKRRAELIGALVFTFLLSTVGIAYYGYSQVEAAVEDTYKPLHYQSDKRHEKVNIKEAEPLSVLLIETDEHQIESLSLLAINPETPSTHVVHIKKDTLPLPNAATEEVVASVEALLDVPIDYYMKADAHAFGQLVKSVKEIEVQNPKAFSTGEYSFPEGAITLNEQEALAFATFSGSEQTGEIEKKKRQQKIIKGVLQQVSTIKQIPQYDDILKIVRTHVETNVTFDEIRTIQKRYREARKDVTQHVVRNDHDAKSVAPIVRKQLAR
ncbi:LCP family protein [Metabacillus iocasae]|uniref:Anionic cell wall polymer biosynthesis LytR-Cps2A-Psr (LCP) family protein n=1 Tax=Priestia iocasae TaxID=2291674 RepID=A0ABS2QS18_9BACI|nr:LCP family protein [Metabacillus iocasae]MBM7702253.1 anionic cell wall polymer biosynthesis LytR-Cps2A-Psr (LCP) family protein [Metabacillus iocasae]